MKYLKCLVFISFLVVLANAFEWKRGVKAIWAWDCDFSDKGNIGRESSKGEECEGKCRASPGCTHFTWASNWCFKKSGTVSKSDAFWKKDAVCGILDYIPPAPTQPATTSLPFGKT